LEIKVLLISTAKGAQGFTQRSQKAKVLILTALRTLSDFSLPPCGQICMLIFRQLIFMLFTDQLQKIIFNHKKSASSAFHYCANKKSRFTAGFLIIKTYFF